MAPSADGLRTRFAQRRRRFWRPGADRESSEYPTCRRPGQSGLRPCAARCLRVRKDFAHCAGRFPRRHALPPDPGLPGVSAPEARRLAPERNTRKGTRPPRFARFAQPAARIARPLELAGDCRLCPRSRRCRVRPGVFAEARKTPAPPPRLPGADAECVECDGAPKRGGRPLRARTRGRRWGAPPSQSTSDRPEDRDSLDVQRSRLRRVGGVPAATPDAGSPQQADNLLGGPSSRQSSERRGGAQTNNKKNTKPRNLIPPKHPHTNQQHSN